MSESDKEHTARSVALEQAYVHEVYEQCAEKTTQSKHWPRVYQFLQELEPGALVCDVGCGNGKYLSVNHGVFKIGIDRCKRFTDIAREKENEVLTCDNLALPFREESFDAVLSIAVVHHFATTERRVHALRELARILRIGGRLVISVWAMEQKHRKFESQDVLVPWPKSYCMNATSDKTKDLNVLNGNEKRDDNTADKYPSFKRNNQRKSKNYWIDPIFSLSPSTSSLSSPNETCYSCFRRALQKLARSRRGRGGRTWFSGSWQSSTRNRRNNDSEDMTDVDELPIELRRVETTHTLITNKHMDTLSIKSKSLGDILEIERLDLVRSRSSIPGLCSTPELILDERSVSSSSSSSKPRLVKQKSCVEETGLENPEDTAIENLIRDLPDFACQSRKYNVLKQSSMNEELMSAERLAEKEQLRRNIMKQASLNEELICKWRTFEALKDSISPVNASRRFQLLKDGFTNTIKRSTTNIEKVSSMSIKNGFVRMLQGWKSGENKSAEVTTKPKAADKVQPVTVMKRSIEGVERRLSREDGSDSSKDSSLQSDTSVDSEDSFASVIFVPKQDVQTPTIETSPRPAALQLGTTSAPPSPRVKQPPEISSSRFKLINMSPLLKQQSADSSRTVVKHAPIVVCKEKPNILQTTSPELRLTSESAEVDEPDTAPLIRAFSDVTKIVREPTNEDENRTARLNQIKELLIQKPGFATRTKPSFPLVRRPSMVTSGRLETVTRILPRLLSLELFNPETDDLDSDSSGVSSPESVGSVISVMSDERYFAKKDVEQKKNNIQTDKVLKSEEKDIAVSDVKQLTDTQYDESLILKSVGEIEDSKTVSSHLYNDPSTILEDKAICDISPKSETLIILDSQDDLRTGTVGTTSPILIASKKSASSQSMKLLQAAASVANSLEDAVETAIQQNIQVESQLLQTAQTAQHHDRDSLWTQSNVRTPAYLKEEHKSASLDLSGYSGESSINKYSQNSSFDFVKIRETSKVTLKPTDNISVGSAGMCWEECNGVSKNISGIVNEAYDKNDEFVNIIHSKLEFQSEIETEFNFQYKSKSFCEDQSAFESIKSKYEIKLETEPETTFHSKYDQMLKSNFESEDISNTESRLESRFNSKCNISVTSDVKEPIINTEDECNFNPITFQSDTETKLQTKLEPESEPILIKSNIDQKPNYSSTMSLLRSNSDEMLDFVMVSKTGEFECDTSRSEKWRSQSGLSMESSDVGDSIENTTSLSDGSQAESRLFTSSTMSLVSGMENQRCSVERRRLHERGRSLDEISSKAERNARNCLVASTDSLSNASSQESLPSDRGGGAITYHQYYHVFREGELDQLINKYVENLHIISSYYDHASWCVVAEKVQVWTI